MALQRTTKNSPSKLEEVPEGRGCVFAAKVILCNVVYYKVDSIISSYLLFIFTDPHQWRNAEWRFYIFYPRPQANFEFWILNFEFPSPKLSTKSGLLTTFLFINFGVTIVAVWLIFCNFEIPNASYLLVFWQKRHKIVCNGLKNRVLHQPYN